MAAEKIGFDVAVSFIGCYHYDSGRDVGFGETVMPDILIRGMDAGSLNRLKARAKQHGRSLQGEAKLVLEQAAGIDAAQVADMFDGWKQRFDGRKFTSSTELISEDRQR